ncbi:MAG: NOB1 family endonuclease [Candidatus Thermoplasmatota archaeon]|nr:NOB1 family endonuclease [Candidatus Thermoplasmatota archaeon]
MMVNDNQRSSIIYIIDTSAVLSGKPLPVDQQECWTVEEIDAEFSKGGSSWRMFQYLREKGLSLHRPSDSSIKKVRSIIQKMGETKRLSTADQSVLALAVDIKKMKKKAVILTDDYSIQNIASVLDVAFQPVSQRGITKTFKWIRRCQGCRRVLSADESICPICGSTAKYVVDKSTKK